MRWSAYAGGGFLGVGTLAVGVAALLGACTRSMQYPMPSGGVSYDQIVRSADGARPGLLILGERSDGSLFGGNGAAIAPDLVFTAMHVADDRVVAIAGRSVQAELVSHGGYPDDHLDDWAILRVSPPLPTEWVVPIGPEPAVGDTLRVRGVIASNVHGGDTRFALFESLGAVANPAWLALDDSRVFAIDQPSWESLSGAPVLDAQGWLVGVVAKARIARGNDGTVARRLPRDEIERALMEREPVVPVSRTVGDP